MIRHKKIVEGVQDPTKAVSRDEWNDEHVISEEATDPVAPANGSLWVNTETGEVRIRSAGRTSPLGADPGLRTVQDFQGANVKGVLNDMKITPAVNARFAGAFRHRILGSINWYFALFAMTLAPGAFEEADRKACVATAIDRGTVGPRGNSAAYTAFTLVTFPSGKVFYCNIAGTTAGAAPSDAAITTAGQFLGDGGVTWEYTGLQVPATWAWFLLDFDVNFLTPIAPDSTDAYAGMLASAAEMAKVDATWLTTASAHPGKTRKQVIDALIQNCCTDELTGTSPGPRLPYTYQHQTRPNGVPYDAIFLGDASEVQRGYRAQAVLDGIVGTSPAAALQNAADVKAGILSTALFENGRFKRYVGQPEYLTVTGNGAYATDFRYHTFPALFGILETLAEHQTYGDAVAKYIRDNVPGLFTQELDDFPIVEGYVALARMGWNIAAEAAVQRQTSRLVGLAVISDTALVSDLLGIGPVQPVASVVGGGGATDLGYTAATRILTSSTGADVTLPLAGSDPGLMAAADKTKLDGIAAGATANSSDATLLNRANHTGTQLASTISNFASTVIATALTGFAVAGSRTAVVATDTVLAAFGKVQKYLNDLATVAFSGSASDLGTGTLPTARMPAFGSGDVSFAASGGAGTIAADAVGNTKLANVPTATFKGRTTAGTGDPEDLTTAQATALLDTFTSGTKGLVPASGGGTTNFLRADGTFAAPPGGGVGSPGGASGEVQFNNAGAFAGATSVEIEAGDLRLVESTNPAAPAAAGVKLFGKSMGGDIVPGFRSPSGQAFALQPHLGESALIWWQASGNGVVDTQSGMAAASSGTSTAVNWASTNFRTRMRWREWLVTAAATTAVAGFRSGQALFTVGGGTNSGGFTFSMIWSPATGVVSTHRGFAGMMNSTAGPTDVNPSTLLNMIGMGYDAADTNIQFMRNDGTGAATKIDLGASFPKPSADRTKVYLIQMFSPPRATQSVSYLVRDLETGAEATGTVTTDLPSTTTALNAYAYMSVGGVSSVIGIAVRNMTIETDF